MNFCWPKDQNFKQQTIFHILLCTYLLMVPILVKVASQILVKKICSKIKCFWLQWSKKKPCKILYVLFRVCHAIMQCIMKNVGATCLTTKQQWVKTVARAHNLLVLGTQATDLSTNVMWSVDLWHMTVLIKGTDGFHKLYDQLVEVNS